MATRSNIAIENQDGTVSSVYCHFDGYIDGVGKTLFEYYRSREKMEQLIALGSISELNETIETTVAYNRDRGERDLRIEKYENVEEFFDKFYNQYSYLFTLDGQFIFSTKGLYRTALLEDALNGEDVL